MSNELQQILNEIKKLNAKQDELSKKIDEMSKVVGAIKSDIYGDDDYDFEIVCPYCEYEFVVDKDNNKNSVKCPNCKNEIELDWTGNLDEDVGCTGSCGSCSGCKIKDEDDDL